MWTNTGWRVDAKARTVCLTPRVNLLKLLAFGITEYLRTNDYRISASINSNQTKAPVGQTAEANQYKRMELDHAGIIFAFLG